MPTFEIRYTDGSQELIEADFHEPAGAFVDFVRTVGAAGEERFTRVDATHIERIVKR